MYKASVVHRGEDGCGMPYTEFTNVYEESGMFPLETKDLSELISKSKKSCEVRGSDEFCISGKGFYGMFYTFQNEEHIIEQIKKGE